MEFHDPIESCPYNIMHRIRRSRMQFHVTTCAQNHKHRDMMQCPFDARHVIKPIEFEHHKSTCPARESVLNYADHDAASQAQLKVLPIDVKPVGKWHEKWDNDPDVRTYNPIQNIKNKPIVYPLIGVSKSKRKIHRIKERARYSRVMEKAGISISQNSFYSEPMNTSSKLSIIEVVYEIGDDSDDEEGYKPLRPPTEFFPANPIDETVDKVTGQTIVSPGCRKRYSDTSSTISDFDETSNESSSVSLSSSSQNYSSKTPSEEFEIYEKLPSASNTTATNNKVQEKYLIPDKLSLVCNNDKHEFGEYQYKNQPKYSVPDLLSNASSMNSYQFETIKPKDQEKSLMFDAIGDVSSMNQYQSKSYKPKDQEKCLISDVISTMSSMDQYQFEPYKPKNQEKCLISDTFSTVTSIDQYQFEPYKLRDQEKCLFSDAISTVTSIDQYQFDPCEPRDQEKCSIPDLLATSEDKCQFELYPCNDQEKFSNFDTVSVDSSKDNNEFEHYKYNDQEKCLSLDASSIASSKNNYKFELYNHKDYEKSFVPETDSVMSSNNVYQFGPHRYQDHEGSPTPDTVSIVSSRDEYQFEPYRYKNQEKYLIPDTVSIASNNDEYECNDQEKFSTPDEVSIIFDKNENLASTQKGVEKSLSLSIDETLEIDSIYSYIEDDTAILTETIEKLAENDEEKDNLSMTDSYIEEDTVILSETIEKVAENDKGRNNFLITDTVYDAFSDDESECNMTPVNWNPNVTPLSSELDETWSESLSYKTAQSSPSSGSSMTTKSPENEVAMEKLFQTIGEIVINDRGHRKKSVSLNHEIDMLKKMPPNQNCGKSNIPNTNRGKLFRRCAANFLNLKP